MAKTILDRRKPTGLTLEQREQLQIRIRAIIQGMPKDQLLRRIKEVCKEFGITE